MFLSRIREAARASGCDVLQARTLAALLEACKEPPGAVVFDLDTERLPVADAVLAVRKEPGLGAVPLFGFVSHAQTERALAAQGWGLTRVFARSAFIKELPRIVSSPNAL